MQLTILPRFDASFLVGSFLPLLRPPLCAMYVRSRAYHIFPEERVPKVCKSVDRVIDKQDFEEMFLRHCCHSRWDALHCHPILHAPTARERLMFSVPTKRSRNRKLPAKVFPERRDHLNPISHPHPRRMARAHAPPVTPPISNRVCVCVCWNLGQQPNKRPHKNRHV